MLDKLQVGYREAFFLIYAVGFLWAAVLTARTLEYPSGILALVANLTSAWAVIRFTSSTIQSRFWARILAVILWTFAALNILGWLDPTVELLDQAAFTLGEFRLSMLLVIKSLLAFAFLLWVIGFVSRLLESSFRNAQGLSPSQKVLFQKLTTIALYTVGGVVGLNIVGLDLTALAAFSGALGLGIGFGLQKVFSNLISGIILLVDKSVKPGDVIAIGDTYGWVNKLGGRCVSVLTRDGKEHLIPNKI